MDTTRKSFSDDSLDKGKNAAEYNNRAEKINSDDFGAIGKRADELDTGQDERRSLIDSYNINDKAHSDSSLDDFIRTTSGFRHADDVNPDTNFNENPGGASAAD